MHNLTRKNFVKLKFHGTNTVTDSDTDTDFLADFRARILARKSARKSVSVSVSAVSYTHLTLPTILRV